MVTIAPGTAILIHAWCLSLYIAILNDFELAFKLDAHRWDRLGGNDPFHFHPSRRHAAPSRKNKLLSFFSRQKVIFIAN